MGLILETALSRLLDQQRDNANEESFLEIAADTFGELSAVIVSLSTETWLSTCPGAGASNVDVWRDRIGEIVGVARPSGEEVERVFRCVSKDNAVDTPVDWDLCGWGSHLDPDAGGLLWGLNGITTGVPASNTEYDYFIAAKIAASNADASIPGLAKYIQNAYGVDSTITGGVGVVYVQLDDPLDLRKRRFLEMMSPVVAGVEMLITNWSDWV